MAETLKLEMVTPYRQVLSEEVDEITGPGSIGEFGLLPGHTPLLTTLRIGDLSYRQGSQTFHVAVNWGYLEVEDDRVTVLVETAELAEDIDIARARAAVGRAEEALRRLSPEDKEFRLMQTALERALNRIQVAEKKGR